MESNDNPQIPNKGDASDIPGLPSGVLKDEAVLLIFSLHSEAGLSGHIQRLRQCSDLGVHACSLYASPIEDCCCVVGLPAVVTLAPHAIDKTYDGVPFGEACRQLEEGGADVVGLNCSRGPRTILPLMEEVRRACKVEMDFSAPSSFPLIPYPLRAIRDRELECNYRT